MLQLKGKQKNGFHNFCALRGNKLVSEIPKFVFGQGVLPPWTPQWGVVPAPHQGLGSPWTPQWGVVPAPHRGLGSPWTPAILAQYSPSTFSNSHACFGLTAPCHLGSCSLSSEGGDFHSLRHPFEPFGYASVLFD